MITAADVLGKTFSRRWRGADAEEVEFFLREVADRLLQIEQECTRLEQTIAERDAQIADFRNHEESLLQSARQAQDTADRSIEAARKEAQLIIQESEQKAAQIVAQARDELAHINETVVILKAKKEAIAARLKMLLHSELELIKSLEAGTEGSTTQAAKPPESRTAELNEIEEIIRTLDPLL